MLGTAILIKSIRCSVVYSTHLCSEGKLYKLPEIKRNEAVSHKSSADSGTFMKGWFC